MTQPERLQVRDSWNYYRGAFHRRSRYFPLLSVFVPLIDKIGDLGYSERLYAGVSLDNLIISVHPRPRDRRQTLLLIAKEDAVEFRLYPKEGEAEVCLTPWNRAESTLEVLLPRLLANPTTESSEALSEGSQI